MGERDERIHSLAALMRSPKSAGDVPLDQVPALLVQIASLQVVLLARLVSANGPRSAPPPVGPDHLLTSDEAAQALGVTPRWLYRHARNLPFARRLSRKVLRFSEAG